MGEKSVGWVRSVLGRSFCGAVGAEAGHLGSVQGRCGRYDIDGDVGFGTMRHSKRCDEHDAGDDEAGEHACAGQAQCFSVCEVGGF